MHTVDRDREMAEKAFDIAFAGDTNGIDEAMAALFAETRRDALEEAARVAEECPIDLPFAPGLPCGAVAASRQIATAIRKLGD